MNNDKAPLLEMRSIKKDFFGNQVLTDINLKLKEGEVLGLVGENGARRCLLPRLSKRSPQGSAWSTRSSP